MRDMCLQFSVNPNVPIKMAIVGNNNSIKINELLCFFDNNFSNLAKSLMISAILNFYNGKEIFELRNILFQLGNDAITTVGNDEAELDGWFKVLTLIVLILFLRR